MPLTAFFAQDRLSADATQVNFPQSWLSSDDSPYTNALDDRPRLTWQAPTPGYFATPSCFLDLNEGAGQISVPLPASNGNPTMWSQTLQVFLNASSLTTLTYAISYDAATSRFTISASGSFSILWSSGAHGGASGNNPRQWLGWGVNPSDTASQATHVAPEKRFGTELFITFDLGSALTIDALAIALEAGTGASINSASYSSIKAFAHSAPLSTVNRADWEANASKTLTFSSQPTETENSLQVAYDSGGAAMSYRYWAFSWRFFDEDPYHAVGILKALKKFGSTSRQITELSGHGLEDPSAPLGIGSYYPSQSLLRWVAPLNFNAWEATDYRATVQAVVREGKAKGLVWALRWDKITDGTYNANDEADKGFLFWGAITSYGQGSYSGAGSFSYISGELTIEQVR